MKLSNEFRFLYYLVFTLIFIGMCGFLIYSIVIQDIPVIILCSFFSVFSFFQKKI